jgi:hypothetical protein
MKRHQKKQPTKRRIFIRAKDRVFQIFSFAQAPDGSIYCSSPDFSDAKWLSVEITENGPQVISTEVIGQGKISFHGSGMVAVRPNDDLKGHRLIIKGNHLLNKNEGKIGARHLFTVFMKEPQYNPEASHLFNRESDYCLETKEELKPLVLVFFAVPQQGITINFQFNLHMDDMVNIPNDVLGLHGFGLRYHDVFWFAYRTKHMEKWPKHAHVCYLDGFIFPIFIGTGPGAYRLEYRQPQYSLNGKEFTIICNKNYPDDYSNT